MKKFYIYLLMALGAVAALSSCKDDEPYPANPNTMSIVTGYAEFDATGGQDTVIVNTNPTSVTIADDASWLTASVSGTTVTLTAAENHDLQSRNTLVTITNANGDQTQINASQEGMIFYLTADHAKFDDTATPVDLPIKSTFPITIISMPDWIESISNVDGSWVMTPSENTTGHIRSGWVYFQNGDQIDSIAVKQFDFDTDIAGTYYLAGYDTNFDLISTQVNLWKSSSYYYLTFTSLNSSLDVTWRLPVQFDDETADLSFTGGSRIGRYTLGTTNCYVVSCLWDIMEGYITWGSSYGMTGDFYYDDEYACQEVDFEDDGTWGDYVAYALRFELFSSYSYFTGNYTGRRGSILNFIFPSLLKFYTDDTSISKEAVVKKVENCYKMTHADVDIPVAIAERVDE